MESKFLDNVKFDKERAIARFNRSNCRVAKLRKFIDFLVVFGLLSAVLKFAGAYFVLVSNYLFNHHVVFIIGNAIIVLLLTLFRQNDDVGRRDFYNDYVKFSEAAAEAESGGGDCEKPIAQCDDLEAVIEKATRQIQRFQRTQSEILKREIAVPELRRSETDNSRKGDSSDAEIETLSNEEFRRRVDAFIDKHWIRKATTSYQLEGVGNYQLRKIA